MSKREYLADWNDMHRIAIRDTDIVDVELLPVLTSNIKYGFFERYTCQCEETKGRLYLNTVCEKCNTRVAYRPNSEDALGWITIDPYCIIQPSAYINLCKFMSEINLRSIIDISSTSNSNPFCGIGINGLYDRFDEVITFFRNEYNDCTSDHFEGDTLNIIKILRDDLFDIEDLEYDVTRREEIYDECINYKNRVFTNHIPVMGFIAKDDKYGNMWGKYIEIYEISKTLNHIDDLSFNENFHREYDKLFSIQVKMNMIIKELLGMTIRSPKLDSGDILK